MRVLLITLLLSVSLLAAPKHRVIVMTDITNEPDDEQSMVRLLLYSNELEIEGLLATTSTYLRDRVAAGQIRQRIEAYRQVRPNLIQHAPGWPTADHLLDVLKAGRPEYGMSGVGAGKSTEASRHIIAVVDRDDPRPVWVTAWGGSTDLAQALWDVNRTRSPAEVAKFVAKLRVYDIAGQDDTGAWACHTFPELFWIRNQRQFQAISIRYSGPLPPEVTGPRTDLFSHAWVDENIQSHGPLGKLYPDAKYKYEGDTPAFAHLFLNGLQVPEKAHYGGWGGRFGPGKTKNVEALPKKVRADEIKFRDYRMYTDAADTWSYYGMTFRDNRHAPLFRWREAFNNDFAARMDWSVTPEYSRANHNPVAAFRGQAGVEPVRLTAAPGETVALSAEGSRDPDGDPLSYQWFDYPEAGGRVEAVPIRQYRARDASFVMPALEDAQEVHIILEVRDSGGPNLFRYRRVIVTNP